MGSMTVPLIILGAFVIIYAILKWGFKINMFAFLNGGIMDIFKIAGIAGGAIEVLTLSDLAIGRGVNMVSAYGRYTMLVFVETGVGLWFVSEMARSFQDKLKDGYITVFEVMKTVLGVSWIFYICYFVTSNIWIAYLESMGKIELQQAYVSLLNSIGGLNLETDTENFEYVDPDKSGQIEYAAWVSIYMSLFFNALSIPWMLRNYWSQFRIVDPNGMLGQKLYSIEFLYGGTEMHITPEEAAKRKKEFEEKAKKAKSTSSSTSTSASAAPKYFSQKGGNGDSLMDYLPFLNSMYGIDPIEFKNYAFEHCGRNFDTNTAMSTSATHSKVKDGSMTPDQALAKLTEDLVNKPTYGLKELYSRSKDLNDEMVVVAKMKDSLLKLEAEIDKTTDPTSRVTKVNDWDIDHSKYKSFVAKVEGLYNKFKSSTSPFIHGFKTRMYPGTYDIAKNVFEADYNMLKSYVQNTKS